MNQNWNRKQKNQFKASIYCSTCQQKKSCGMLDEEKKYCCPCLRKIWEELEQEKLLVEEAQLLLNNYRKGAINCQCLGSEKPRIKYINSTGSGWSKCEGKQCEKIIEGAGHHRVIKNRNDPRFWGLEVEERVLCLECLGKFQEQMPISKRYNFNKYLKRYQKTTFKAF